MSASDPAGADRERPRAPLLAVEDLRVAFGDGARVVRAVDGVSLSIAGGETLGLVGESGSGKSLTALSIIRLVPEPGRLAARSITFEGRDLMTLDERQMRAVRGARIGFVFQEPMTALNPVYSVGAQVAEALHVHGLASRRDARARAVDLLREVAVPDPHTRASDYPHQLSGGLRQRVTIAIALACRPSLLVADEPTTALDVTIQAQILDLLRELKQRHHLAMLIVSHDLGVVAHTTDRVAVMYAGRIVEQAPVRALFAAPRHPYTQGLLASVPGGQAGTRLKAIEGTVPSPAALPPGCAFGPRCPHVRDACRREVPEARGVGPDHLVRCVLAS
jgi:oligopeptide/dipeptide ABC transporter ATP-binding protein